MKKDGTKFEFMKKDGTKFEFKGTRSAKGNGSAKNKGVSMGAAEEMYRGGATNISLHNGDYLPGDLH